MLEAKNLSKTYRSDKIDYEVLKNINLTIEAGECVAIIGKSGSGKSTLMHLLACLDAPTAGGLSLDGRDFADLSTKERDKLRNEKFGFVFQQFFLNGRETVFENVVLPMRIRGAAQYRLTKDAMDALEAVGLRDKEQKRAKDLSGGEKQRVCIARALVTKPSVIFADEPTGNLDSNTSEAIENLLFELNRETGITLIIVTHDPDLAAKCRRVIELKDGEIINDSALILSQVDNFDETQLTATHDLTGDNEQPKNNNLTNSKIRNRFKNRLRRSEFTLQRVFFSHQDTLKREFRTNVFYETMGFN